MRLLKELQEAVKQVQRRHGLTDDGIIGPGVIDALNVPIERRIQQIEEFPKSLQEKKAERRALYNDILVSSVARFTAGMRPSQPIRTTSVAWISCRVRFAIISGQASASVARSSRPTS